MLACDIPLVNFKKQVYKLKKPNPIPKWQGARHFLASIPPAVDPFLLLLKIEKCRDLPNPLFCGTLPSII
jgi:hypothetical protein